MLRIDIDKKFTNKVAEYIANGYMINPTTMSGHQGEVCKVDLIKDTNFIRIWLNDEPVRDPNNKYYFMRARVLRVSKLGCSYRASYGGFDTIWNDGLETVEEFFFYKIDNRGGQRSSWYIEDYAQYLQCMAIHKERLSKHFFNDSLKLIDNPKAIEIAKKYLRKRLGCTRIHQKFLRVEKQNSLYTICYKNKRYPLIVDSMLG